MSVIKYPDGLFEWSPAVCNLNVYKLVSLPIAAISILEYLFKIKVSIFLFLLDWYAKHSVFLTLSPVEILVYRILVLYKNWPSLYGKMSSKGSVIFVCFCFYHLYICPIGVNCERALFLTQEERKGPVIPDRASQQRSGNYLLPAGINVATGSQGSYRENDGWHNWLGGDNDKK